MTDIIIFFVGAFVTILWGSMVGMLIYAANTPIKRLETEPFDDTLDTGSSPVLAKRANS